jgi:hypothetical protein
LNSISETLNSGRDFLNIQLLLLGLFTRRLGWMQGYTFSGAREHRKSRHTALFHIKL